MSDFFDGVIAFGVVLLFLILPIIGWCWNLVKAFQHINDPLTAMECFRLFGIIAFPIGIVIGYF